MVSFNCDGCGDVVKKPKLVQHYNRCYAPFTCLDCSVQFGTPQEAHSSCITEDEKYQKSLYKGKKTGQPVTAKAPTDAAPCSARATNAITAEVATAAPTTDMGGTEQKERKRKRDNTKKDKASSADEPAVSLASLTSATARLAKKKGSVTLKDIVEYISTKKGVSSKSVKSALLEDVHITTRDDGTLAIVQP